MLAGHDDDHDDDDDMLAPRRGDIGLSDIGLSYMGDMGDMGLRDIGLSDMGDMGLSDIGHWEHWFK